MLTKAIFTTNQVPITNSQDFHLIRGVLRMFSMGVKMAAQLAPNSRPAKA